jgi:hypothetical protein
MKQHVTTHPVLYLLIILFFPLLFLFACSEDDADADAKAMLTGKWEQLERSVDKSPATIDSTRFYMQIGEDNICILYDTRKSAISANKVEKRSGWSYSGGMFNIAVDLPASWKTTSTPDLLIMEGRRFAPSGVLVITELKYKRISTILIN